MKASCVLVVSMMVAVGRCRRGRTGAARAGARPVVVGGVRPRPGRSRSSSARCVDELDASDVIVHVVASPALPTGMIGTMRFVAQLGGARYVRIDLASLAAPDVRVATLAHELQHACEVARSGPDRTTRCGRCIGPSATRCPAPATPSRPTAPAGPAPTCGPNCAAAAGQAARPPNSEPRLTESRRAALQCRHPGRAEAPPDAPRISWPVPIEVVPIAGARRPDRKARGASIFADM